MAKQTNIVSFDDAKTASRSRRARTAQPRSDKRQSASVLEYDMQRDEIDVYSPSAQQSQQACNLGFTDNGLRRISVYEEQVEDDRAPASTRSSRTSKSSRANRTNSSKRMAASGKSTNVQAMEADGKKISKREQRRKKREKKRAERMFEKQFESSSASVTASAAESEGAPRAALYEGKMGSMHRKSARMQSASSAEPQSAKINPAGWFSNLNISPRALKIGTALLCLVLIGVFLYTPAQQYYQAQRERDRLAAEYAVLAERNDSLDSQNAMLSSNAGMEDAVRQKYGYVVSGDQAGVVTGLSDTTTDPSRDYENIEANVLSSTVKAPEEWYTPYLDAFFGVS